MRRVVRCSRCARCARWLPAGFTSGEHLRCTLSGCDVDPDDGCTFGEAGEPQRGAVPYDVELSHAMYTYDW